MPDTTLTLKRTISLPLLVFYGVGTILGAGIYVLSGEVARESGLHTPYAFFCAAIVVACSAYSYAKLSQRYPASAGEAVYVLEVLKLNWLAIAIGWAIMFTGIVSSATIAKGFAAYLIPFINLPDYLIISTLIIGLGVLAIWGVAQAVWFAAALTLMEIAGILMVIFIAAPSLPSFIESNPELLNWPNLDEMHGIVFGAFIAFYAYIGFEDIVNMAEEVKNPKRNVALAIYLSLVITTIIYFLTALSLLTLLPLENLTKSTAPFADVARQHSLLSVELITLISLAAITNGALVQIIMASRVLFGMSKRNLAPTVLAKIWQKTKTPVLATIVITVIVILFSLAFPLATLAKTTSTIVLCIFVVINVCQWLVQWQNRKQNKFQSFVGLAIPSIGIILCISFLLIQLKNS